MNQVLPRKLQNKGWKGKCETWSCSSQTNVIRVSLCKMQDYNPQEDREDIRSLNIILEIITPNLSSLGELYFQDYFKWSFYYFKKTSVLFLSSRSHGVYYPWTLFKRMENFSFIEVIFFHFHNQKEIGSIGSQLEKWTLR